MLMCASKPGLKKHDGFLLAVFLWDHLLWGKEASHQVVVILKQPHGEAHVGRIKASCPEPVRSFPVASM